MGTRISAALLHAFILFIGAGSVYSLLPVFESDDWLLRPEVETLDHHRERREADKNETDSNTRCVIRNLKDIEQKLEKSLPPEKNISKAAALAKPHQLFSNSDAATAEKFCEIYKASRSRLASCGESQMKTFAAKALAVVDYICIDRYEDFIKAFPCIQKVDEEIDATCNKNCSTYESAAEKLNSAGASVVKKYKPSEIKELFAKSCLYVSCIMECQQPALEAKCGTKVMQLEMSSIGVTFRNLDDMMRQSSAYNVWPNECKPLSSIDKASHEESTTAATAASSSTAATSSSVKNVSSDTNGSLAITTTKQPVTASSSVSKNTANSSSQSSSATASTRSGSAVSSSSTTLSTSSSSVRANATASPRNNDNASQAHSTNAPISSTTVATSSGTANATARAKLRSLHRN